MTHPSTSTPAESGRPAGLDDLASSVARMARVGACSSPSFSPDGTRLAFISNLSGLPQIWTVATTGGWPDLVTALDDPIQGVSWSPDGAWLALSLAPGGGMNAQVHPRFARVPGSAPTAPICDG